MADNIATFKFVVRTIAQRHGLHASFMPKPFSFFNGSGMHLSLSLWNGQQNVFVDPEEPFCPSKNAGSFIAGLIRHADAVTAITNPLVNSYKRLVSSELAPAIKGWSFQNRNTMIRIPDQHDNGSHVIMRSPDPAAKPLPDNCCLPGSGLRGCSKGNNAAAGG
jgi:glutamine synthetase